MTSHKHIWGGGERVGDDLTTTKEAIFRQDVTIF